jgi:translation initiation factor 2 alpha subunit (eIF-2alpha)
VRMCVKEGDKEVVSMIIVSSSHRYVNLKTSTLTQHC